jgi:hypothetical protein
MSGPHSSVPRARRSSALATRTLALHALWLIAACDSATITPSDAGPEASASLPTSTATNVDSSAVPTTDGALVPSVSTPLAPTTSVSASQSGTSTAPDETPTPSTADSAPTPSESAGSSSVDPAPIESTGEGAGGADSLPSMGDAAVGGNAGEEVVPADIPWIPVDELPLIEEMPDPLTLYDGTKVTTEAQWRARRQEMIQLLEDYEYGHMPPPPGNVTAEVSTDSKSVDVGGQGATYRKLHLSFGPEASLGFDLGVFTPAPDNSAASPEGGYPTLISLTYNADEKSAGSASAALERGYAVVTIPFAQLGADSTDYASTAFFPAYPDYDWRDFSAWAWGISRAVDYLVTDPEIDADKLMITGVSRLAQAVLLAGAFDERIALTAPVAGGMALRFSGKEQGGGLGQGITEVVDQNTYWFGPHFEEFRNQTDRLPCDQHWLPALTAPRLFIMANSLQDEYGRAYAAVQTYLGALPVYEFLGAEQNLGVSFREGGHGMTSEDWTNILDFADQYLLKKVGARNFHELPSDDQLP